MQFGIKSLLGMMVLLAAFVMGLFQFSGTVCLFALLVAHALAPAIWFAGFCGNQTRGLKAFFLGGIVTGITPWIATAVMFFSGLRSLSFDSSSTNELENRLMLLAWWSSSGIIAICGGLLSYWVYRCSGYDASKQPVSQGNSTPVEVDSDASNPLN